MYKSKFSRSLLLDGLVGLLMEVVRNSKSELHYSRVRQIVKDVWVVFETADKDIFSETSLVVHFPRASFLSIIFDEVNIAQAPFCKCLASTSLDPDVTEENAYRMAVSYMQCINIYIKEDRSTTS